MADYLPLVTAAVSVALTGLLARQFLERRKRHQLVWTVSLALLGLAAVLAFLGNADVVGWNAALYRLYLPLTALPVGLIGSAFSSCSETIRRLRERTATTGSQRLS